MNVPNKFYLRPTNGNFAIRTVVVAKIARTSGNGIKFEHFKLEMWKNVLWLFQITNWLITIVVTPENCTDSFCKARKYFLSK